MASGATVTNFGQIFSRDGEEARNFLKLFLFKKIAITQTSMLSSSEGARVDSRS